MRVSSNMPAGNAIYKIQERINRLTEQITADKNVLKPSDDPIATRQILDLENVVKKSDQYISNINKSSIWLNMTNTALTGLKDMVSEARKLVGTIVGGTGTGTDGQQARDSVVTQLRDIQNQLINMGNTQSGDQYIFAGFTNNVKPFSPPAAYTGDSNVITVDTGRNSTIGINLAGDAVLKGTTNGASPGPYGGVDILGTLDSLITEIENNNAPQMKALATVFDGSMNQLNYAQSDVANKLKRLESAKNLLTRDKNTALNIISDRQSVDMAKAAMELNKEKTALEAALSAIAKTSQVSLLDYL